MANGFLVDVLEGCPQMALFEVRTPSLASPGILPGSAGGGNTASTWKQPLGKSFSRACWLPCFGQTIHHSHIKHSQKTATARLARVKEDVTQMIAHKTAFDYRVLNGRGKNTNIWTSCHGGSPLIKLKTLWLEAKPGLLKVS